MTDLTNPDQLVGLLREAVLAMVRSEGPDLTARQFAVLLTVSLQEGPHTVRGLAAQLNVSKPAITRALDRLEMFDLARRKTDPADRRSVLIQRTTKGVNFVRHLRNVMAEAAKNPTEVRLLTAPGNAEPALQAV